MADALSPLPVPSPSLPIARFFVCRVFEKAGAYCEKFGGALRMSGPEAIDELSGGLSALEFPRAEMDEDGQEKRLKLASYEIVALINLNPGTASAAKSLIPSLEKLTDEEIENDIIRLLRRSSARYTGYEGVP